MSAWTVCWEPTAWWQSKLQRAGTEADRAVLRGTPWCTRVSTALLSLAAAPGGVSEHPALAGATHPWGGSVAVCKSTLDRRSKLRRSRGRSRQLGGRRAHGSDMQQVLARSGQCREHPVSREETAAAGQRLKAKAPRHYPAPRAPPPRPWSRVFLSRGQFVFEEGLLSPLGVLKRLAVKALQQRDLARSHAAPRGGGRPLGRVCEQVRSALTRRRGSWRLWAGQVAGALDLAAPSPARL